MTHSIESKSLSFIEKFTPTLSSVTYLKRILVDRTRQIWYGKFSESTERNFGPYITKTARGIAMISHLGIRIPVALGITFPAIIGTYQAVVSNIMGFAHSSEYPDKIHNFVNYTHAYLGIDVSSYIATTLTNIGIGNETIVNLIRTSVFMPFKVNYFVFNVLTSTNNYLENISGNPILGVDIPQMINNGLDIVRGATISDKSLIASVGVMVLFQIVTSRPMRHKLKNATSPQPDGNPESQARITHTELESLEAKLTYARQFTSPLDDELVLLLKPIVEASVALTSNTDIPKTKLKSLYVNLYNSLPASAAELRKSVIEASQKVK